MIDWSKYDLKDNPFLAIPAIKILSQDIRANGELYYSKFSKKETTEILQMIRSDQFPMIFLLTDGAILGNGKSAFLANIFWTLQKEEKNVLWVHARDNPYVRNLLSATVDSFIVHGHILKLKENMPDITAEDIRKQLKNTDTTFGSSTIHALNVILNSREDEMTYTYSNIKRRNPTLDYAELFEALLALYYSVVEKNRFIIFIDQFEEYVLSHTSDKQKKKLGHELNDLQRAIGEITTIIVSTHPEATDTIISSGAEAETFTRIDTSHIKLPLMTRNDLLKMIELYLSEFRLPKFKKSRYYPFIKRIIEYSIEMTNLNPRNLILALRGGLIYGALNNFSQINEKFLINNHSKMFGGLENKWKEYKSGDWKYQIE